MQINHDFKLGVVKMKRKRIRNCVGIFIGGKFKECTIAPKKSQPKKGNILKIYHDYKIIGTFPAQRLRFKARAWNPKYFGSLRSINGVAGKPVYFEILEDSMLEIREVREMGNLLSAPYNTLAPSDKIGVTQYHFISEDDKYGVLSINAEDADGNALMIDYLKDNKQDLYFFEDGTCKTGKELSL